MLYLLTSKPVNSHLFELNFTDALPSPLHFSCTETKHSSKPSKKFTFFCFDSEHLLSKTQSASPIFKSKSILKLRLKKLFKNELNQSNCVDLPQDVQNDFQSLDLFESPIDLNFNSQNNLAGLGFSINSSFNQSVFSLKSLLDDSTLDCTTHEQLNLVNNNNSCAQLLSTKPKNSISVGWLHPETEYCNSNVTGDYDNLSNMDEHHTDQHASESDAGVSVFVCKNNSFNHYYYNDNRDSNSGLSMNVNCSSANNSHSSDLMLNTTTFESQNILYISSTDSPPTNLSSEKISRKPSFCRFYKKHKKSTINDVQQLLNGFLFFTDSPTPFKTSNQDRKFYSQPLQTPSKVICSTNSQDNLAIYNHDSPSSKKSSYSSSKVDFQSLPHPKEFSNITNPPKTYLPTYAVLSSDDDSSLSELESTDLKPYSNDLYTNAVKKIGHEFTSSQEHSNCNKNKENSNFFSETLKQKGLVDLEAFLSSSDTSLDYFFESKSREIEADRNIDQIGDSIVNNKVSSSPQIISPDLYFKNAADYAALEYDSNIQVDITKVPYVTHQNSDSIVNSKVSSSPQIISPDLYCKNAADYTALEYNSNIQVDNTKVPYVTDSNIFNPTRKKNRPSTAIKTPEFSLVNNILQKNKELFDSLSSPKSTESKLTSPNSIFALKSPAFNINSSPINSAAFDLFTKPYLSCKGDDDTEDFNSAFQNNDTENTIKTHIINKHKASKPSLLCKKSDSCPSTFKLNSIFNFLNDEKQYGKSPRKIKQLKHNSSKQLEKDFELIKGLQVNIDKSVFEVNKLRNSSNVPSKAKTKSRLCTRAKKNNRNKQITDSSSDFFENNQDMPIVDNSLDTEDYSAVYSQHLLVEQLTEADINFKILNNDHDGLVTWQYTNYVKYDVQNAIFLPNSDPTTETVKSALIVYSANYFVELVTNEQDMLNTHIKVLYNSHRLQQLFVIVYGYSSFLKKNQAKLAQDFENCVREAGIKPLIQQNNDYGIPPPHKSISVNLAPYITENDVSYISCSSNSSKNINSNANISLASDDSDSYNESNNLPSKKRQPGKKITKSLSKKHVSGRLGTKKSLVATSSQVKDAIIQIEIDYPQTFFHMDINDLSALSKLITRLSVNVALNLLEKQRNDLNSSSYFSQGLNISSSVIKNGVGHKDTFNKMLEQIPKVTSLVARSITNTYPSIESLYRGWEQLAKTISMENPKYQNSTTENIKKLQLELQKDMLSSLMVNNGRGFGERPIGSAISRIVYNFFNALDPHEYVLENYKN
ncbi:hypothetical protein BB561_003489 [Smittium simulii]|uniref:ERCC4 domain-containing protein n=1 Tax=Smittium simulii TaxID=133385 RepID=A0A2T9YL24_9FUNG|nr:hypothetical protein BB561_003489 [Smittium simulii]